MTDTPACGPCTQAERCCGMTPEEMIELLCEYPQMRVTKTVHDPEVYDGGCVYTLSINGIICGSELVEPGFVRDYIKRNVKGVE